MKLKYIKTGGHFKKSVIKAAKIMIKEKKRRQTLKGGYTKFFVSFDMIKGEKIFSVYSGKEIGVEDCEGIYVYVHNINLQE